MLAATTQRVATLDTAYGLPWARGIRVRVRTDRIVPYGRSRTQAMSAILTFSPNYRSTRGRKPRPYKKQTTRQCKVSCPACVSGETGKSLYIARMSQTTIDIGLPTCPCGSEMIQEGAEDEEVG